MFRRSLAFALLLYAIGLCTGYAVAKADTVNLAQGVRIEERSSNPALKYHTNGANLYLQTGAVVGPRDLEMGTYVPGIPSLLNGDIGAHGILNIGADISDMVRIQNGEHRTVLATRRAGIVVNGQLRVCGSACFDVERRLARLAYRVDRLVRRVRALR